MKLGTSTSCLRPEHAAGGVAPALGLAEHVEQPLARRVVVRALRRPRSGSGPSAPPCRPRARSGRAPAGGSVSVGAAACGTGSASSTQNSGSGSGSPPRALAQLVEEPATASPRPGRRRSPPSSPSPARPAGRPRRSARSRTAAAPDIRSTISTSARPRASPGRGLRRDQLVPDAQVQLGLRRARRARVERRHAVRLTEEEGQADRDPGSAPTGRRAARSSSSHSDARAGRAELGVARAQRPAASHDAHDAALLELEQVAVLLGHRRAAQVAVRLERLRAVGHLAASGDGAASRRPRPGPGRG